MISKWIRFEVPASEADSLRSALEPLAVASKAEAGCIHYAAFESSDQPEAFCVLEQWETDEHFQAHQKAPHLATFKEAIGGLDISKAAESLKEL